MEHRSYSSNHNLDLQSPKPMLHYCINQPKYKVARCTHELHGGSTYSSLQSHMNQFRFDPSTIEYDPVNTKYAAASWAEFSCIYVVDYKYRQECNWNAATLLPFCALKPSGLPGAYTYSQRTRPQFSMTKLSARSWCGSLEASPSLLINYNWLLAFKNELIFIFRTFIPDDRPVHHEIWIFPFFGISGSLIWLIYVK